MPSVAWRVGFHLLQQSRPDGRGAIVRMVARSSLHQSGIPASPPSDVCRASDTRRHRRATKDRARRHQATRETANARDKHHLHRVERGDSALGVNLHGGNLANQRPHLSIAPASPRRTGRATLVASSATGSVQAVHQ
jgi:hypothetical protein